MKNAAFQSERGVFAFQICVSAGEGLSCAAFARCPRARRLANPTMIATAPHNKSEQTKTPLKNGTNSANHAKSAIIPKLNIKIPMAKFIFPILKLIQCASFSGETRIRVTGRRFVFEPEDGKKGREEGFRKRALKSKPMRIAPTETLFTSSLPFFPSSGSKQTSHP